MINPQSKATEICEDCDPLSDEGIKECAKRICLEIVKGSWYDLEGVDNAEGDENWEYCCGGDRDLHGLYWGVFEAKWGLAGDNKLLPAPPLVIREPDNVYIQTYDCPKPKKGKKKKQHPSAKWKKKHAKRMKAQKARFTKHKKRKATLDKRKKQLAKRKTPSEKWKKKHHKKLLKQAERLGCSEDLCKVWFPEDAVMHLAIPFKSKGYVGPSGTITDTGGFQVWCGPGNLEEGCELPPEWELLEHPLLSWYFTDERGESKEVTVDDGYPAPRESHGKKVIVGKKKMINDTWLYQLPFFEIKEEPATDCCVPVFWNKEKDFKATCENFIGFRCDGLIKPDGLTTITKSLERVRSRNINADFWGAWYSSVENEDGTIQEPKLYEGDLVNKQNLIDQPCACDCYEEQYKKIGFWGWEE